MNKNIRFVRSFVIELLCYAALVFGYFFLVLHFLGDWLKHIFDDDKRLYAIVALALMIGQGVVLEMVTTALLKLIRTRTE